jgi:hypothetical protein
MWSRPTPLWLVGYFPTTQGGEGLVASLRSHFGSTACQGALDPCSAVLASDRQGKPLGPRCASGIWAVGVRDMVAGGGSWHKGRKFWLEPEHWKPAGRKDRWQPEGRKSYSVCSGCSHWVWDERKGTSCYKCSTPFAGCGKGHGQEQGLRFKDPEAGTDPGLLLPFLQAMEQVPELQEYVRLLKGVVQVDSSPKQPVWQVSKGRVEKANKEVQKLEGAQKRMEDSIKLWETKLETAYSELVETKDGLQSAYVEQATAQLERKTMLEKGVDLTVDEEQDKEPADKRRRKEEADADMGTEEQQLEEARKRFMEARSQLERKRKSRNEPEPTAIPLPPGRFNEAAKQVAQKVAEAKALLASQPAAGGPPRDLPPVPTGGLG